MRHINELVQKESTFLVLLTTVLLTLPLPYAFGTAALVLWLAVSLYSLRFHKMEWNNQWWIPILFYAVIVLSLIWSVNFKQSLRGLERQLGFVLLPIAFIAMPKLKKASLLKVFYASSLGMAGYGLVFIIMALFRFLSGNSPEVFFYHELVSPFSLNAIYVSVWVSFALVFLVFKTQRNKKNILAIFVLGLFLLMLASKIIIAITVFILLLGAIRYFSRKKLIASGIIGLLAVLLLWFTNNPIKNRFSVEINDSNISEVLNCEKFGPVYYWTGTTLRIFQARIFWEMLQEDSIFWKGYGINASQDKIEAKHKEHDLYKGFYNYNFHNQYLQAFAEVGIISFVFTVLLLLVPFTGYIKTKELLFLAFFIIMASVFLTESYLWRQRGIFHFFTLFGLLVLLKEQLVRETEN
ncbi:MAG: hypothetical protein CMC74_13620 [Flavobacteriaceae bacterium]|nr:hypothetical protein [Flavobacteriaceae bacterium]|tara:strand:- start:106192 stop:107418 length:1227 start_codon:yes stop_codon:yes gene_type:complete